MQLSMTEHYSTRSILLLDTNKSEDTDTGTKLGDDDQSKVGRVYACMS